jgi:hypothetical protein
MAHRSGPGDEESQADRDRRKPLQLHPLELAFAQEAIRKQVAERRYQDAVIRIADDAKYRAAVIQLRIPWGPLPVSNYGFLGVDVMLTPGLAGQGGTSGLSQWTAPGLDLSGAAIAGLPLGTPLTTEIVATATGNMGWSVPSNGSFNNTLFTLELIPTTATCPGSPAVNTTLIYTCGVNIVSLPCNYYGDISSVPISLSDDLIVHSTVGHPFDLKTSFAINSAPSLPGGVSGSLDNNFLIPSL